MQEAQTKKRKLQSYNVGNSTGKSLSITNSTDSALVVINALSDDGSVAQLYEQSLTVLQTTDGNKAIAAGATATVIVEDAHADSGGTSSMILARADNLFPVKVIRLTVENDTNSYPPVTVTGAYAINMKLAAKFQKIITAFPSSSLAADFATALAGSDPAKAAAFFQSTDDFKTLTIEDVVAVQTYYTTIPFVWAYYESDKNYGLHATDGVTNKYVGYISLTNEGAAPLNDDKSLQGFAITYTNENISTPLYYSKGQFVDDVNSESPGICLQGLFVLKSSITKSDDDQAIVAVLVGTINGESVLGYDEEQALQNNGQLKDVLSSLDILVHPDDTKGWLELAGVILASVLGLIVLAKSVKMVVDKAPGNDPLTPEQIRDQIREVTQGNLNRIKNLGIKGGDKLKIPQDVNASLDNVKKTGNDLLLKENKAKMLDIVDQQGKMLEQLANYSSSSQLQEVADSLEYIYETVSETNAAYLGDPIPGLMRDLKLNASTLGTEISRVNSSFSADAKASIEAATEAVETITKQVESNEELRADLAENKTPEERKLEELFEAF